jgi:hypothetical protein
MIGNNEPIAYDVFNKKLSAKFGKKMMVIPKWLVIFLSAFSDTITYILKVLTLFL